jgi:Flp pilus assembly protein TadD
MPTRRPLVLVMAGLLMALVTALSACTSGTSKPKASGTSPTTAAPVSTASSTATAPSHDSGNPADIAAIRRAYQQFLDPKIPVAQKTALIQDGPAFLATMQQLSKNPAAATISIQIATVTVTSPNRATVVFTLLVAGSPLLAGQKGYAVRENGRWQVAGETFCGLVAAQGPANVPKTCSSPAATSLPT